MHGSRADNARLLDALIEANDAAPCDVVVCAPFVYLWECGRALKDSRIALVHRTSAPKRKAHSPVRFRRQCSRTLAVRTRSSATPSAARFIHEDDALVARKFVAAQAAGLAPILCVGETLEEREGGVTPPVVARQLDAVLGLAGVAAFARAIVAYEPVWAIGTGKNASPAQAQEVHAFIRERFLTRDATIGGALRLLYGGSVKAANAAELFGKPDVDGGLVGGASLQADEFVRICAAAA